MNFFGHAVLSSYVAPERRFILGSMLPDFSTMTGTRLGTIREPMISAGIENHILVDDHFHRCEIFKKALRQTTEALECAGVQRGPARAVAHVGSELLIDGLLSERKSAMVAYRDALALMCSPEVGHWGLGPGTEAFVRLSRRLQSAPLPGAYRNPAFVTDRLEFILRGRRRLRLTARDLPATTHHLAQTKLYLEQNTDNLLHQLCESMNIAHPST